MSADCPPWEILSREDGPDLTLFQVARHRVRNPRNAYELDAIVLRAPEWVNVVGITEEGTYLFVQQWRFGLEAPTLEIPGGVVDPGEEPAAAAARELAEETGHGGGDLRLLGVSSANPAFMTNSCHHFLATGLKPIGAQQLDDGESLQVKAFGATEVRRRIHEGTIHHSLSIAALARVLDLRCLP